ncbi:peptidoglycan DD-metalloendopeptidase family protein [Paenibacillus thermoaerophilus]|uniref:Peptidoglycan DD-metalloendopeptidase family protein n=1 Tax=Paenibacillus thermoaerophilus TaxID=1215385 RepID=A0ABW2UYU1_9BACL|nr:M23 family metallopeptidase [Paenibacillus thermoaerophilus]TMV17286.1 M23 family metallopeptidase [Paenibacillus thermoaerophilus]
MRNRMDDPEWVWKQRQKEWERHDGSWTSAFGPSVPDGSFAGNRRAAGPSEPAESASGFEADLPGLPSGRAGERLSPLREGETRQPGHPPNAGLSPWFKRFLRRTIVAGIVFAALAGLSRLDQPWAGPVRAGVFYLLTDEWRTESLAAWYERAFEGAPAWLPAYMPERDDAVKADARPLQPLRPPLEHYRVSRAYDAKTGFVTLQASVPAAAVRAIDTGFVLETGVSRNGGFLVKIQHRNGYVSTYEGLGTVAVRRSDWVREGDPLGKLADSASPELRWSVAKDGRPVNPRNVVPLG